MVKRGKTVYEINAGELISFKPYDGRTFVNATNKPATKLVVINYPK